MFKKFILHTDRPTNKAYRIIKIVEVKIEAYDNLRYESHKAFQ